METSNLVMNFDENRIYVKNFHENFEYKFNIYGDGKPLYHGDFSYLECYREKGAYHQPKDSLSNYKKIKFVMIKKTPIVKIDENDPYGEEDWGDWNTAEKIEKEWDLVKMSISNMVFGEIIEEKDYMKEGKIYCYK